MISRRGFLKFLGAATAASAGGIALIDTQKTFFLPPAGGWHQALKIRKVEQYLINLDAMAYRWDAAWDTSSGPKQGYILSDPYELTGFGLQSRNDDQVAIDALKRMMEKDHGTPNSAQFILELPRNLGRAEYIYA